MKTDGLRRRLGDFFLFAVLVANLACGGLLLAWMREDLARDMVAEESTLVTTKVNSYLWGKIVLFASVAGGDGRAFEGQGFPAELGPTAVVRELPKEWNFQRVRSGTGGWLPVFIGTPQDLPGRGAVLPLAVKAGNPEGERFVVGSAPLGDLSGYFADLKQRGIFCRLVDGGGNHLFGERKEFSAPMVPRLQGITPILTGGITQGWAAQVFVRSGEARLPILPQAVLGLFFLMNAGTLVFLRQRFIGPQQSALAAISETLTEQGERMPSRTSPESLARTVKSRFLRDRQLAEIEKQRLEGTFERRVIEMGQAQKVLLSHHKLTKKMLQSRRVDEVFDTLMDGITEGCGFPGALLGKVSRDGFLVFPGDPDPVTGIPTRIPLWDPRSLLARTFWTGSNTLLMIPRDLPHLDEEERILAGGEGEAICLLPLTRNIKARCAEIKNCGDRTCPNFFSENLRCWLRHVPQDFFQPDASPEIFRENLQGCLKCEVFPPSALVVLRAAGNGKEIHRESIAPVSTLVSEAALALEVASLYDNMKLMAVTDGLTGLYNHREFYQALRRELERARRYRHTLSLLIIDVDDFKQFNDRFGHPAGDFALRKVADLLRGCARTTDTIARYGGEEFAVILPESPSVGALMVAERIKTEISEHNFIPNSSYSVHLTVSIGVYSSDGGGISEDQMVALADEAAYVAKKQGKNRVVVKAVN